MAAVAQSLRHIKCVAVGDGAVGKTCLLVSYSTDEFPEDYVPTVFDNYACKVTVDAQPVQIELWDTAGQEDYDRIRPLSYPDTDVFLVIFSVVNRSSMDNVKNKWIPELQAQPMVDLRATKIILVGQKIDLRGVAEFAGEVISTEEGRAIASAIGAAAYVECSAKTREGVKPAFDETCASRLAAFSTTVPPRIHTHRIRITLGLSGGGGAAARPRDSLGGRIRARTHKALETITPEMENALADPSSELRQCLAVVKHGWLEKKGGNTVIMPDGTLRKERNFAKGGRRNWTRRYFVLLSNNVLVYYEQENQGPNSYKGILQLGTGTVVQLLDGPDFVVSASEADIADSSKPSLLLRAADSSTREQWADFIESAVVSAGAAPAAGAPEPMTEEPEMDF